jgi:hypothetical protein
VLSRETWDGSEAPPFEDEAYLKRFSAETARERHPSRSCTVRE